VATGDACTTTTASRNRIRVNAYIKGPDGAPPLTGEKVAILAR